MEAFDRIRRDRGDAPAGLVIDVARLDPDGESLVGEIPVEALDLDPDDFLFKPRSGLRYNLTAQLLGEELLVRGSVEEDFICMCVRCTVEFPWTAVDDEVAISVQPGDNFFVDLTDELRECIILCLPSNPVCDEDCKGLCPRCGKNLNNGACSCKPVGDDRWGELDGLKTE